MISLDKLRANIQDAFTFERKLVWRNILGIFGLHFVSIFSIYYYAHTAKFWTWPFGTYLVNEIFNTDVKMYSFQDGF